MLRRRARRRHAFAIALGVAVGMLFVVLALASSLPPSGYNWPPASRVESNSMAISGPAGRGGIGAGAEPADCTTMLLDLDSTGRVQLWVIPQTEGYSSNISVPIPFFYYWTGTTGATHISTVVTITDPADGIAMVLQTSGGENGTAYFGFVFSASDCS